MSDLAFNSSRPEILGAALKLGASSLLIGCSLQANTAASANTNASAAAVGVFETLGPENLAVASPEEMALASVRGHRTLLAHGSKSNLH